MRSASRVFFAIGLFGLVAGVVYAAASRFSLDNLQGVLILGVFALACMFLAYFLGAQGRIEPDGLTLPGAHDAHDDGEIHLPGPSWAPALYGVAGFVTVLGAVFDYRALVAGVVLVVATSIWWGIESVRDYRRELAHAAPSAHPDRDAIDLARAVLGFTRLHGGANAVVQHVGRGAGEIVLVGADGRWGILESRDVALAREACALAGTTVSDTWPAGLGSRVRTDEDWWRRMGGTSPMGAGHVAPRDGTTQVAARVFFALGIFALLADVLYAASSRFSFDNLQGMVILTAFALANYYLYLGLKHAKARPEDAAYAGDDYVTIEPAEPDPPVDLETLHLPGPSWWPAFFSVAGGMVVFGAVFHTGLLLGGAGALVLCCVGWGLESVREYRQQISGQHHGTQDALTPSANPLAH